MAILGVIHDISSKHSAGGNNWKSISLSKEYYIIYLPPLKLSAFLFRCYVLTKVKLASVRRNKVKLACNS